MGEYAQMSKLSETSRLRAEKRAGQTPPNFKTKDGALSYKVVDHRDAPRVEGTVCRVEITDIKRAEDQPCKGAGLRLLDDLKAELVDEFPGTTLRFHAVTHGMNSCEGRFWISNHPQHGIHDEKCYTTASDNECVCPVEHRGIPDPELNEDIECELYRDLTR